MMRLVLEDLSYPHFKWQKKQLIVIIKSRNSFWWKSFSYQKRSAGLDELGIIPGSMGARSYEEKLILSLFVHVLTALGVP